MRTKSSKQRILVVDDAPENIRVLGETLRFDYKISFATNGRQAIDMARSDNPPDLILLDIMMPEMDGYEVLRRLKADESTRDIPVIFVTAKSEEESETEGLQLGAVDYVTKPFSPARVLARVRAHLEQKLAKEALRENEERLEIAGRLAYDLIYEWNVKEGTLEWFGGTDEILGYHVGEIPRNLAGWADLIHPDDAGGLADAGERHRSSTEPISYEYRIRHNDGSWRYVSDRALPMLDDEGRPYKWIGVCKDITERREAEEALRESEERVRAVFEASPDPLVVYDNQGHPRFMNPAFTRVFGWTLDELRGRTIPFVPDDQKEATAATVRALYESGRPLTLETKRLTKEGNTLDILVSAAVIKESHGQPTGMVVNLTDITETKRLQDQLQRAQKMEAIGTLAGGLAHDFNNLLSVIIGNISMAKEDLKPEHGTYPLLNDAEEASLRTKELTHQLITFSRGGAPIRKRGTIIGLLKGATHLALAGSNVGCDFSLAEDLWPVEHDETQMKHVVTHLVTNACEAMPGGGTIKVTAENFTASTQEEKADIPGSHGEYVRISIQDHGVGIPEKGLSSIFDPYFSTKERGEKRGMGLGLA
ncbi:MAG: PAS domain S-box protein, partial [Thermodesulfobacteriota bacterium]|nr:PAS domain S-box protein [Thermodesulfobacteriota bacterium]